MVNAIIMVIAIIVDEWPEGKEWKDDSVEKKEHERRCGLVRNSLTSWLWSDDFGYSNNSNGSVDDRDQVLKEVIGERAMLQPIIPATATITIEAVKK